MMAWRAPAAGGPRLPSAASVAKRIAEIEASGITGASVAELRQLRQAHAIAQRRERGVRGVADAPEIPPAQAELQRLGFVPSPAPAPAPPQRAGGWVTRLTSRGEERVWVEDGEEAER